MSTPKRIAILLCENAWGGSITLPQEILLTALAFQHRKQEPASIAITTVSATGEAIRSFSGYQLNADLALSDATMRFDAVLVPAIWQINHQYLNSHRAACDWLQQQFQCGAMMFGFLTGTYLLAQSGILTGRRATTHWHYAADFRKRYPKVTLLADQQQTSDGRIFCAGGVNATMDLCLNLVQTFCSTSIAQHCERHCWMGTRRDYQQLSFDMSEQKQHQDARIAEVQQWLESHYADPISLNEVAARFAFSVRTLTRRFKLATGYSVSQYVEYYRLNIAKVRLMNTEESIQDICFNVGYDSMTVFARRFKAHFSLSASDYRKKNRKKDD